MGRVFITLDPPATVRVTIQIEDDGPGNPPQRSDKEIFARGQAARHDRQSRNRLGLAIVRDVAEIYGGKVSLSEKRGSWAA
jgi:signal transduction histidine kinase